MLELAKDLRLKPVYVLGHLHSLWHAALEQQEDGDLSSWSDDLIAKMACYEGDALQFVSLLQQHGWLDGKLLHDWTDYAGKYLTAKYRTANHKRLRQILLKFKSVNSRSKIRRKPIRLGQVGSDSENGEQGGWGGPEALIDLYNAMAADELPTVTTVSPKRIEKARAYLAKFPERSFWEEVFKETKLSLFLRGLKKSAGHDRFKGDFDWLLTVGKDGTENCVKVFEGKYRDDKK